MFFLISTQFCYFMMGILVYLGVGQIIGFIESMSRSQISSWFYTILGAILVLISFYKPKKKMESRFLEWLPAQVSIRAMIILGIIVFAFEFTTSIPYFYSILLMDGLAFNTRSEEHTSELQSRENLVCRLLLEKKKKKLYRR